jgi:predicted TIM-barrel fold metal-dependent hydrolase
MNPISSKPAASCLPEGPAVDSHFHVFSAGVGLPGARYVPSYDASLSDWWSAASACGVGRGVLVQTSFLGTDNRRLLQELAAHPERLRGVAVVAPDVAPAELQALHNAGVRGLRLNLSGVSHDVGAWTSACALWDTLPGLGWHVELHTDLGALPPVLAALPAALPLVIDHMGKPERVAADDPTVRALARRAAQASVHVKLSGAYRLGGRDASGLARLWLAELGPQRLLWGSDWPHTNHEQEANYPQLMLKLEHWLNDDAAMGAALRANPQALYWADDEVAC